MVVKLDTLPFVESEYTKRFTFDAYENPKLKELRERYHLDDVVAAESYGEHKIQVVRFRDVVSAKRCQIVFVSADEKLNLARILSGLRRPALLTVGDFEGFAKGGGMINLRQAPDGKVRLRINLDAVRASELIVSGKLLRVAEVVNAEVKN